MTEYKAYRVRLINGELMYIRTKSTLTEGDVIKFKTTFNKVQCHFGIVESQCSENGKCRFAVVSHPITNIASLGGFKEIKDCPYLISNASVNLETVDTDFRTSHMSIPASVSLEVGFGYDIETPEMLTGYHIFADGEVFAFLFSSNHCVAIVENDECDSGIEEVHFDITEDMNAVKIASSENCRNVTETVFAALTFALAVNFKEGASVGISKELFSTLRFGADEDLDDDTDTEDDFAAISRIFTRRALA